MVCGLKIHTPYIVFYEKNKAFRAKNKEKSSFKRQTMEGVENWK